MNPDAGTLESQTIKGGHPQLTASELVENLVDKTLLGDFAALFKYIVAIDKNGNMEGKNNAGAHHFGKWSIDESNSTFTIWWDSGWVNTTNRAYNVDGKIKLFEIETGQWQTTFTQITQGAQQPLILPDFQ